MPPPIGGGITTHMYRLSKIEKDAIFLDSKKIIGNRKFKSWLLKQIFDFRKKNFIFHPNALFTRLIFYFLSIVSIHQFSLVIHGRALLDQYNESNVLIKTLIRKMLKRAKFIQVVNLEFKRYILSLNVKNKNIFIKNAFLPPPVEDKEKIIKKYNKKITDFIRQRKPIIISNGGFLDFYNNKDLYGLDMCIELTRLFKKDYPNIGFLFALSDEKRNFDYFLKMKNRIKKLDIEENFHFLTGRKELWPLFKKADLMIRPTNTDGDSISVREALYFNIPVVASNVTTRPKGCYLFKNRDLNDLYDKCRNILILQKIKANDNNCI